MLNDHEKKALLTRLKRIQGQTSGVVRMVEQDTYCIDVLQQIAAIQGALAQVSKRLLQSHMQTCVVSALESKDASTRDRAIEEVLNLFAKNSTSGSNR